MRNTLSLFSIAFGLLASIPLNLSASTFALEIEPVKLQANKDGLVTASYLESCGTEFAGFLYQDSEGHELKVAVVLRRYHARCMGLLGMQSVPLPMVLASHYAGISSIDPSLEPLIVKSVPIQNLHFTQQALKAEAHAVFTSQCGETVGLFIQPQATGTLFSVLESSAAKSRTCNRSTKTLSIGGLDPSRLSHFKLDQTSSGEEPAAFDLDRAPTQLLSTDDLDTETKSFQVYYLRRCNEAPIGIIQKNQGNSLQISVLVARYDNKICTNAGPKKQWTRFEQVLTIKADQIARALQRPMQKDLALVRPTSFRWNASATENSTLEVFTQSVCSRDLGLVSHSSLEGLAIGILQAKSSHPCNSSLKKVSYAYSIEPHSARQPDVKPLQLVGS